MGFDAVVRGRLAKYAVFTNRARRSEFRWFMFRCLSAFVPRPAAPALLAGLTRAGRPAIGVPTPPALGVMGRQV